MALERWTNPIFPRACSPRHGLQSCRGRASRNGRVSDLPPEIPHATIRNFLIAVRLTCARAACSDEAEWGDTVLLAHECDVEDFCKPEQSEPSKPKESGKE